MIRVIFIICIIGLYVWFQSENKKPRSEIEEAHGSLNKSIDPNREVYKYDWNTDTYIYKDEIDYSPYRDRSDDGEGFPDLTVRIQGQDNSIKLNEGLKENTIYIIDGFEYTAFKTGNGRYRLIKTKMR